MTELEKLTKELELYKKALQLACGNDSDKWLQNAKEELRKFKPSAAEKAILKALPEEYKWIARSKNGNLIVTEEKPEKKGSSWNGGKSQDLSAFNHLLAKVTWDEDPYLIADLTNQKTS